MSKVTLCILCCGVSSLALVNCTNQHTETSDIQAESVEHNMLSEHLERHTQKTSLDQIRFSKFIFGDEWLNDRLPLTKNDYPMTECAQDWLRSSNAVSIVSNPFDVKPRTYESITDVTQILNAAGLVGGPTYPSDGTEFWKELDHVTRMQLVRQQCGDTMFAREVWPVPKTWWNFNLNEAAEAVHDEYPGYWQAKHLEGMFGAFGKDFEVDHNIIRKRSKFEFVWGAVMLAEVNTWTIGVVGTHNFVTKWMYGRPRPEEIAWLIKTGSIGVNDGVPSHIIENVMKMKNVKKMEDYSAYEEGSPRHPSWPAMHSAASNISLWLAVILNLTPEQRREAQRVDYAVSYGRTVAGVHYVSDNMDGLNLGQEVIAAELPAYMEATYGSDPEKVREKIAKVRFDWRSFDHTKEMTVPSCPTIYS